MYVCVYVFMYVCMYLQVIDFICMCIQINCTSCKPGTHRNDEICIEHASEAATHFSEYFGNSLESSVHQLFLPPPHFSTPLPLNLLVVACCLQAYSYGFPPDSHHFSKETYNFLKFSKCISRGLAVEFLPVTSLILLHPSYTFGSTHKPKFMHKRKNTKTTQL